MACKGCASVNQRTFPGEMNVIFPGIKRVSLAPVYISTNFLVCLACGYTEHVVPAIELERLRKGMDTPRSAGA
jgi:hypothetical protein